jgi:hypothetical protein
LCSLAPPKATSHDEAPDNERGGRRRHEVLLLSRRLPYGSNERGGRLRHEVLLVPSSSRSDERVGRLLADVLLAEAALASKNCVVVCIKIDGGYKI